MRFYFSFEKFSADWWAAWWFPFVKCFWLKPNKTKSQSHVVYVYSLRIFQTSFFFFINYKWVSFFCAFWWSPSKQNGIGLVACVTCGSAHITKYLVSLTTQCHCDAGRFFLFIYLPSMSFFFLPKNLNMIFVEHELNLTCLLWLHPNLRRAFCFFSFVNK